VVYRGGESPWLLFIGEAPGRDEDRLGVPFVGRAGARLDRAIASLGLSPEEFGIVNLLKCRPPENRFDAHAAATCRPHLDRQIDLLQPRRLVTLGAHALKALDPSAPPITQAAGQPRTAVGRPLFPLLHPAAVSHAPRYGERWTEDLGRLHEWLIAPSAQTL
jgi:DNA polymerase